MTKLVHPVEKLLQTITYKSVEFEVVERPDVLWVGCVVYADNNIDFPFADDDLTLLHRYQSLLDVPKLELINPDWSASITVNCDVNDRPSGVLFGQETYSCQQDDRYDMLTQPGGLWLRLLNDKNAAKLLGKKKPALYEYYQIMRCVAKENGYVLDPGNHVRVEYSCHAEYHLPQHRSYAYIPIIELKE